jgi:3D (Asp-Asp-Asp) domain-containing protein
LKNNIAKAGFILAVVAALGLSSSFRLYTLSNDFEKLESSHQMLRESHQRLADDNDSLLQNVQSLTDQNTTLTDKFKKSEDTLLKVNDENKKLKQTIQQMKQEEKQKPVVVSRSNREPSGSWMNFVATYYDANYQSTGKRPGDRGYGITASGKKVTAGRTIAVDPRIIPLGTWVLVKYPNGKIEKRRADDTGGAIKGNKIDIYVPQATLSSGKHPVGIKILN